MFYISFKNLLFCAVLMSLFACQNESSKSKTTAAEHSPTTDSTKSKEAISSTNPAADIALSFSLTLARNEKSKDSNSRTRVYTLKGQDLIIEEKTTGARSKAPSSHQLRLTTESLMALDKFLKSPTWNQAKESVFPIKGLVEQSAVLEHAGITILVRGDADAYNQDPLARSLERLGAAFGYLFNGEQDAFLRLVEGLSTQ